MVGGLNGIRLYTPKRKGNLGVFNVQVEAFALWGDRKFQELSDNISLESRLDFFSWLWIAPKTTRAASNCGRSPFSMMKNAGVSLSKPRQKHANAKHPFLSLVSECVNPSPLEVDPIRPSI